MQTIVYKGPQYDTKQNSVAPHVFGFRKFDDLTSSKIIVSAILKQIRMSSQNHSRYFASSAVHYRNCGGEGNR